MKKERFAKRLITFCSVFVMAFLLSISALAAESSGLVYGDNGTITRAEWLHDLVTVFDLTVEDEELPDHYYQDLSSDKEYYRDMMVAVGYGIVDIPSGESIEPEASVTREFAVSTLNYCLGIKSEEENPAATFSDYSDIPEDLREDAQVAVDHSWLNLKSGAFRPDAEVTSAEVRAMLDDAESIWNSTDVDENYNNTFEFADGVIEVPETSSVEIGENQVTIYDPDVTIEEGDIFAVYINGLPQIYRAVSVSNTDDGLVITTEIPEDTDTLQNVDAEGVQEADLATAVAEEGVDITYFVGGTEAKGYTDGVPYKNPRLAGDKPIKAVNYKKDIAIGKGVSVNVSCTLYNTMLSYKVKTLNHEAYAAITGDVTVSGTVSGDLNEISGIPKSVSLGGINVGGVGYIGIYGKATASGKITVTYEAEYMAGVQHSDREGTRYIKYFKKTNTSSEAEAELGVGVGIEARFDLTCVSGRVYAETGMKASYKDKVYNDGKKPNWCATFKAWMYAEAGASLKVDYGISKKSFEKKIVVYDINNSPVRIISHKEDGVRVAQCSRDPKDTGFWTNGWYRGIYGGCGGGYGLNGAGEVVPVYTYETYENDMKQTVARITGYTGTAYTLAIPDEIDGYTVEAIKEKAFANRSDIRVLNMPDTILKVGTQAFASCANLQSIHLSSKVTDLQRNTFEKCNSLTSVTIPKTVTTGYNVFSHCENLKHVYFEDGTKTVTPNLFQDCTGLEEITFPDGITEIGRNSFMGCTSLKKVVMSDTILSVVASAFENCTELKELTLSHNIQTIEAVSFRNCTALTEIFIPKSLEKCPTGHGETGPFTGCTNLTDITFEEGIERIPAALFAGCPAITEMTIPDTVKTIDQNAFNSCENLTKVVIPDSVTKIDWWAFENCGRLVTAELGNGILEIGQASFSGCVNLKDLTLPKNLVSLDQVTFAGCKSLTEINIPRSLTKAFAGHNDNGPFQNCSNLATVNFEAGRTSIPAQLFAGCDGIKNITIPDTVTSIGRGAFHSCTNLEKIVIPDKVTQIEDLVFYGCSSMESVTFGKSLTKMGTSAFERCTSLSEINWNDKITELGRVVFKDTTSLKKVTLPDQVTTIGIGTFNGSGLTELDTNKVTNIAAEAFRGCKDLKTLKLNSSLKKISGDLAFADCTALTDVVLPDQLETMGKSEFYNCTSLNNVKLGNGISYLPESTFESCTGLVSIVLPYNITRIDKNAFKECTKLREVTIPQQTTTIADTIFSYPSNITIYGVSGSYAETYANAKGITFVNKENPATKVTLSETEITLANGAEKKLIMTVTPEDFTDKISWKSSNTDVVTVDQSGVLKAAAIGTATIRVTVGSVNATCKVTVTQPVTGIQLNKTNVELNGQETVQLSATVRPDTAANKEISWTSSAPEIASVSESGLVTALKKGTAVITATAKDGSNVSASCNVTVKNNVYLVTEVSGLESTHPYEDNCSDTWIYTYPSDTESLQMTFDERTAIDEFGDKLYIYDGTDGLVGTYTGTELSGKTVTIPGQTVKIKLESDESDTSWGFKVTSIKGEGDIEKEDQTLEGTQNYEKSYGDADFALDMHLTKGDGTLSYRSDDDQVAAVSDRGVVSIKGVGMATITVTASGTRYYN